MRLGLIVQVSGHGNFGSLDNDPPAAMRYTECRLQSVSSAVLLADLDFDTVDFAPNFDGSQACPLVSAQCLNLHNTAIQYPHPSLRGLCIASGWLLTVCGAAEFLRCAMLSCQALISAQCELLLQEEPRVLPARVPNLLINGSSGIAVGIATRIPPHNLREVVSGLHALIDKPDITIPELMEHIPAPDFPTGGFEPRC